jgi:hypothetical protein
MNQVVDHVVKIALLLRLRRRIFTAQNPHQADVVGTVAQNVQRFQQARQPIALNVQLRFDRRARRIGQSRLGRRRFSGRSSRRFVASGGFAGGGFAGCRFAGCRFAASRRFTGVIAADFGRVGFGTGFVRRRGVFRWRGGFRVGGRLGCWFVRRCLAGHRFAGCFARWFGRRVAAGFGGRRSVGGFRGRLWCGGRSERAPDLRRLPQDDARKLGDGLHECAPRSTAKDSV